MMGSCLLSHVFEQPWVITARVYPLFPWHLKACSLDMCRLILGLWIFALLLARADIQDSYDSYWIILAKWSRQNEVECSNHRKSMPPPRCLPLLLTQSFSIGSFTASKGRPLVYWLASYFSLRSNLMATSVARSNLQKLMGQDHKPQCLGKSSLILKPFLS